MNRESTVRCASFEGGKHDELSTSMRSVTCFRAVAFVALLCAAIAGDAWSEWQIFGETQGLPSVIVNDVIEDRDGNLWFASYGGVTFYDGVNWKTYRNENGFWSTFAYKLLEDSSGDIWALASNVYRFDGRTWRKYDTSGALPIGSFGIARIAEDTQGNIWVGSNRGVIRFDGETWTKYAEELPDERVNDVCATTDGAVWVATSQGAAKFSGSTWTIHRVGWVNFIYEDSRGRLWFGCRFGPVVMFDGAEWREFTVEDGLADDWIYSIGGDSRGNTWFGTGEGLSRYDGRRWRTFTSADGLPDNTVKAIKEDRWGNLWFATRGGACRYDGVSIWPVDETDGLAEECVYSLFVSDRGDIWVGTCNSGVSRFDGDSWMTFTESDGLIDNTVTAISQDNLGSMWFGTPRGASRFNGSNWFNYDVYDGLGGDDINDIDVDIYGNVWFGIDGGGASRYDGENWETYTRPLGIANNDVFSVLAVRSGDVWFGTAKGVSRLSDGEWITYDEGDGLPGERVLDIMEDRDGTIWASTTEGVALYDGTGWTAYTEADGLSDNGVNAICQDERGVVWFGTNSRSVCSLNGEVWTAYDINDGLSASSVSAIAADRLGGLWFASASDAAPLVYFMPDRVPPKTVILSGPPPIATDSSPTVAFAAAHGEVQGVHFSYSIDGSEWSEWSTSSVWVGDEVEDELHVVEVKSRDRAGNVDPHWPSLSFEVDATPPEPVLTSPYFGQVVRDTLIVKGNAFDDRFSGYMIEVRERNADAWQGVFDSSVPAVNGVLGSWYTPSVPDGEYELRVSLLDTLGVTGTDEVDIVVDNVAPWASQTSPALIRVATGGSVYTTDGSAALYFPPNSFDAEVVVEIDELAEAEVPDILNGSCLRVLSGYEISWENVSLRKPAALEISLDNMERQPGVHYALFAAGADSAWTQFGGTLGPEGKAISASVDRPGRYAVYSVSGTERSDRELSELTIAPRVFSPSGSFANVRAAIGFTLGRPSTVSVRIYNRAGRMVREIISGEYLYEGANLVQWDGRDRDGELVEDGVYLVTVEALGQKRVKPLAVVR